MLLIFGLLFSSSVSEILPTGQLSNVPWRRTGVKYTNNEAYFDVIEEIDAIIDKSGTTVFAEIQGYVSVLCLASCHIVTMPSLTIFSHKLLLSLCRLIA